MVESISFGSIKFLYLLLYIMRMRGKLILLLSFLLVSLSSTSRVEEEGEPFNGLIFDMLGQPVKGARIYTVDRRCYARSDKQGRFGLLNVEATDTIHVKYQKICYDIPVEGRKSIRITLGDQVVQSALEDEELVDLGYAFVKRRNSVLPSNAISGDQLRRTGKTNVLAALQGLVPGLEIHAASFGGDASVQMRGVNSLNLSTTPLFFVDGVEVTSLEFVSVYDVESVEVLKEASIYGARGANGAILVHTIRGPK